MGIYRAPENPVIRPENVRPSREDFEVIGVFNAGVARSGDEIILLLRVAERPMGDSTDVVLCPIYDVDSGKIILKPFSKNDPQNDFSDPRLVLRPGETYLTSISHLRRARSRDSVRFQIADAPALGPANRYETFGIEDPRITCIDDTGSPTRKWVPKRDESRLGDPSASGGPTYYVDYVGVSPLGVTTCLASTRDFQSFERHGVIFHPDNKDVVIFPARIGGKFYALHRPHSSLFLRNDIWLAESPDLLCWGRHRHLMGTRDGLWDETRIGAGAVPFHTEKGWLEFYHGADRNNRYCMGAVLLDSEQPWKILARSERPLFKPQADYEQAGFFGNVVFSCGLLFEDETLKVYYGAADTTICYAEIPLADAYRNLNL